MTQMGERFKEMCKDVSYKTPTAPADTGAEGEATKLTNPQIDIADDSEAVNTLIDELSDEAIAGRQRKAYLENLNRAQAKLADENQEHDYEHEYFENEERQEVNS